MSSCDVHMSGDGRGSLRTRRESVPSGFTTIRRREGAVAEAGFGARHLLVQVSSQLVK
jgi:hypothetical protein